jgi:hypothetical protein
MPSASKVTTDHEEIRRWAEARDGRPSHVKSTGKEDDPGILRIDFPGYSGEGSLEEIEWDEWFDKFDERGLALLYQETTAGGQQSNFNKIVTRETAAENEDRSHRASSRGKRARSSSRVEKGTRTSSGRGSRSKNATRSRNKNRSEGRSSKKSTTARSAQGAGRSSSKTRSSATSHKKGRSSAKAASRPSRSTGRKQAVSAGKSPSKRSASGRSNNRRAA